MTPRIRQDVSMTDHMADPRTAARTTPNTPARARLADGFANGVVSYWYQEIGLPTPGARLPGSRDVDVCIVGAGYTGLWTAYYLKREQTNLRIGVLGELAGVRRRYADTHGRAATIELQRAMFDTVDEVVKTAAEEGIEADIV